MNSAESDDPLVEDMMSHMRPPFPVSDSHPGSKVADFYANRSVFITGATGFVGKALVEKLIRSCDKMKRIYILIREKRGKTVRERLLDLIKSKYFDRIRANCNGSNRLLEEKLYPIRGDITLPKLGIGPEDMRLLSQDCTLVFNSAATIRFVEPIDVAVRNNIYSIGELFELCNQLEHLEALVHLSTAYSNCHKRDTIYEILYEPPMRGDQILAAVEKLAAIKEQIHVCPSPIDESVANQPKEHRSSSGKFSRGAREFQKFYQDEVNFPPSSPHSNGTKSSPRQENGLVTSASSASLLLAGEASTTTTATSESKGRPERDATDSYDLLAEFTRIALRMSNRPNTYTFTKAISESFLLDKTRSRPDRYSSDKVHVAIVRPSIVCGAWREPLVGLVDNYNGPTGAILSLYTGALQAMPGCGERVADLVPVDMVVNMIICTGWFLAREGRADARGRCGNGSDSALAPGASTLSDDGIRRDNGLFLFNFVSGCRNPAKWHYVTELIAKLAYQYPSKFLQRLPSSYFIEAGKYYKLYDKLNHKLPAFLMDLIRTKLLRQRLDNRSRAMTSYSRIRQMTETLTPFTSNQWRFSDSNTRSLFQALDPIDRQLFHFDVASIDWTNYLRSYIIGSRVYTMRDEPTNLAEACRNLRRREHLNGMFVGAMLLLLYFLLIRGGQLEALALGLLRSVVL